MRYLDSMSKEGQTPTNTPPRSLIGGSNYHKSPQLSQAELLSPNMRSKLANDFEQEQHEDAEDADSNIQLGERSQVGGASDVGEPQAPPVKQRLKHESYDSGPSFGNFGPMPNDDRAPFNNSWNVRHIPSTLEMY